MNIKFTPERALIINRTAVIADLHLGIEDACGIPNVQIDEMVERIERIDADRIVIAGDLKHEFGKILPLEWEDVKKFMKYILDRFDVVVVKGNHDNFLKSILFKFGLDLLEEFDLEGWKIVHGHRDCSAKKIIMGHEHPAIRIRFYKFHCFLRVKGKKEVIVLPSFSPLVKGYDVTSCRFMSPILKDVDCRDVEVYAVDDEVLYIGNIEEIKSLKIRDVLELWRF